MNKHQYEQAHRASEQAHNKFRDWVDDGTHHLAREAMELCHRLTQDIKSQKNPRSIEASVKAVISALQRVRAYGDQIIDFRHVDALISNYQALIMDLRKFDNY